MADTKISADPSATDLVGAVIPIVQGGVNKKASSTLFQTPLGFNPSRRILYMNNVSASFTGSTAEVLVDSFKIPGGTIQPNDILNIVTAFSKSGVSNNDTIRRRIHTSNDLAGTIIDTLVYNNVWAKQSRELIFKNSVSSQVYQVAGGAVASDIVVSNTGPTSLSIDFSKDQWIIISIQHANSADTETLQHWYIELIRA